MVPSMAPQGTATEPPPHDHVVRFVQGDDELIESLMTFVVDGWRRHEPVVVVATQKHRHALETELAARGWHPDRLRAAGRLVPLDAAEMLSVFMVEGRPDPDLFRTHLDGVLDQLRPGKVRIFGEMVRLLWDTGNVAAAIELEECWNALGAERSFALLCGYPHSVLEPASLAEVGRVCALHSDVLPPPGFAGAFAASGAAAASQERSRTFFPSPNSIHAVRVFVREALVLWGQDERVDDAMLVSSELATNALRHSISPFHVTVIRSGGEVTISMTDAGSGVAGGRDAQDDEQSGRGFQIVEALTTRWGVADEPTGKTVWAVLGA